jgi:hypothetical protein
MPIEVPLVAGSRKTPADLIGKGLAELERPLPHRLMADHDASGREQLLDHPKAQRKPKIQPHAIADHFSREAVTGVARVTGRFHPSPMPRSGHPPVNLTVPPGLFPMPSRKQRCFMPRGIDSGKQERQVNTLAESRRLVAPTGGQTTLTYAGCPGLLWHSGFDGADPRLRLPASVTHSNED